MIRNNRPNNELTIDEEFMEDPTVASTQDMSVDDVRGNSIQSMGAPSLEQLKQYR